MRKLFSGVLSAFLALIFWASGLRSRIVRQNFKVVGLRSPQFYRLRLGFRLAQTLLALALPGRLPQPRLHPRSRACLTALLRGPTLLLTAHFGNWEAQASAWGRLGVNLLGAARPLRGRAAHALLAALRARHGVHVVFSSVPRTALRHLTPTPNFTGGCFGLLEGGYNHNVLGQNVLALIRGLIHYG